MDTKKSNLPIILHIPHASKLIPPSVADQFIISKTDLNNEINLMTDHFTDSLLDPMQTSEEKKIISPVSRLVVDVERFENDDQEIMSTVGMGAIYERGSQKQKIRRQLDEAEKKDLLNRYYSSHHAKLNYTTQSTLDSHKQALIIDVHSYPSAPLPYELNETQHRPEICIGTCVYHTPQILKDLLVKYLEKEGFEIALDTPFEGTLIPSPYWQQNRNVMGFMIEVRRDIYMSEINFDKLHTFNAVSQRISKALLLTLDNFFKD